MSENTPPKSKHNLELRVDVCMAKKKIRSIAELHRRLINIGVDISHPQLWRVVENRANTLSVPLLNGLLEVLDCTIQDLFEDKGALVHQAAGTQ